MFPILAPPNVPVAGDAPSGRKSSALEAASTADGAASKGTESKSFSAVLLALASLGSPLHAASAPSLNGVPVRSSDVAAFESVLLVDHATMHSAAKHAEGSLEASSLMAAFDGVDGVARAAPPTANEEETWLGFNVVDGHVMLGKPVEIGELANLGALRPLDGAALTDLLAMERTAGSGLSATEVGIPVEVAFGGILSGAEIAGMSPLGESAETAAFLQVAPQIGPPPVTAEVQESPPLDPTMLNRLSRDFVSRLERVADRMFTEYGLQLDVVEGYRSQRRQDALFAQGRTAPGNVVTWTTNSLHTSGAAADVFVDGAPVNPAQAAILSRIASEEGLKTLYPYDSGHIQLDGARGRGALGPEGPLDRPPAPASNSGRGSPPPGIAQPAPVARVARPARPGGPGGMALLSPTAGGATSGPSQDAGPVVDRSPVPLSAGDESGPASVETVAALPNPTTAAAPLISSLMHEGGPLGTPARASPLVSAPGIDPTLLQGAGEASAYRRLHLPIEGVAGSASLDIGVRPGSVDAFLNVSDPQLAAELKRSLHELRQVLADRGIETRGLGVRLVADTAGEVAQVTSELAGKGSAGDANSGQTSSNGERERGARYRDTAEEQDLSRQPRREHSDKEKN